MIYVAKVLALAGSTRAGSLNKRLIKVDAAAAQKTGAQVTLIDLRDYPMPLYDGDLEAEKGIPEHAMRFKQLMLGNDGLLLACPEYNSSIPGVLKNAIDWASRSAPGEEELACFRGKVAALTSASPGALGGLRSLMHVRQILGNIGVLVLPEQVAVPKAHEAFNDDGTLKDARRQQAIERLATALTQTLVKLKG